MPLSIIDGFQLTSVSNPVLHKMAEPLGLLEDLLGTWKGKGFNQIWRPFHGSQDRFLELNETLETIQFDDIPGDIPNRGLLQDDINLAGIRYLQQIQDAHVKGPNHRPAGIHIEPGIWINIPNTSNPSDPATVSRMANIPHGTSLVSQGTAFSVAGPPMFKVADITPFTLPPAPPTLVPFPESKLAIPSTFRTPAVDIPGVTQAMVDNPNVVLKAAIAGQDIISTTVLNVSTVDLNPPTSGGGTSNIAFLQGAAAGPNAQATQMDAIFWIEKVKEASGSIKLQLQYSQRVILKFANLAWPHISVATLVKE